MLASAHRNAIQMIRSSRPVCFVGAGLGVFAGRRYNKGDVIDRNAAVVVPTGQAFALQIGNYVFGAPFALESWLVLGSGSLCNYRSKPNALLAWNDSSDKTSVFLVAQESIEAGDEIFVSYGGDEWFSQRDLHLQDPDPTAQAPASSSSTGSSVLPRQKRCLSDVYVAPSKIPGAGNGAFAGRAFAAGSIVSIAPVIAVPKLRFVKTDLRPYLVGTQTLDIAFVPLDKAALANHNGSFPNLKLCWFHGDGANHEDMCSIMPDVLETGAVENKNDLVKHPFANLYLAYVARRDIAVNDELTLSYYGNSDPKIIDCEAEEESDSGMEAPLSSDAESNSTKSEKDCDSYPMEWRAEEPIALIDMSPAFFTPEFILADYVDTFVQDARRMLESLDTSKMFDFISNRVHEVSDRMMWKPE